MKIIVNLILIAVIMGTILALVWNKPVQFSPAVVKKAIEEVHE